MVHIKTRAGSVVSCLEKLFPEFKEEGRAMKIPLIGNHATIDGGRVYWRWNSVHEENEEEAVLEVYPNGIDIRVNGRLRYSGEPHLIKRLWIDVKGGIFQKDEYTEGYFLYFGCTEKDFY